MAAGGPLAVRRGRSVGVGLPRGAASRTRPAGSPLAAGGLPRAAVPAPRSGLAFGLRRPPAPRFRSLAAPMGPPSPVGPPWRGVTREGAPPTPEDLAAAGKGRKRRCQPTPASRSIHRLPPRRRTRTARAQKEVPGVPQPPRPGRWEGKRPGSGVPCRLRTPEQGGSRYPGAWPSLRDPPSGDRGTIVAAPLAVAAPECPGPPHPPAVRVTPPHVSSKHST